MPDVHDDTPGAGEPNPSTEPKRKQTRRLGGRPRKKPGEGRTAQIHVLLTEAERERIRTWAAETNLTVSDFMRRRALGRPILPRVDGEARRQLRRIGVNLNQLARVANAAGQLAHEDELRATVEEIRAVLRELELPPPGPKPGE
jgi:uncharacterized protein (DUF1778 family)